MSPWFLVLAIATAGVGAGRAAAQESCPTPASTYELIQRGIFDRHGCSRDYCHGEHRQEGLDLRAGQSYASLFSSEHDEDHADAEGELEMVEPGKPEESLLWLSMAVKTLGWRGVPAAPMPLDRLPISPDELSGLSLWITAGAPQHGVVNGVSGLIQPCTPAQPSSDSIPLPCDQNEPGLILPNLSIDAPKDIRVLYKGDHRVIEFTTSVTNQGYGPLIVQASSRPTGPGQSLNAVQILDKTDGTQCSRPAGHIMYQVDGYKWAYGNMADFELRKDDPNYGPVVARSSKPAFCLLDSEPLRSSQNAQHQFEAHCEDNVGRMGISAGFRDIYSRIYPAQWLDIDADPSAPVQPGAYYLVNVVDPTQTFLEEDGSRASNAAYTRISVNLPNLSGPEIQPTPLPSPPATEPPSVRRPPHPQRPPRLPRPPRSSLSTHPVRAPRPLPMPRPSRAPRPALPTPIR